MSTTVSYKGQTLATVSNQTKTLLTEGKYLEDDITLTDVSGGGAVLGTKSISANGTYDAEDDSLDGYSEVTVAVPNSYSAGDEGKVVSNGALVSQGSDTVTENDTYDTTLINELTVNVSGGGGGFTIDDAAEANFGDDVVLPSATQVNMLFRGSTIKTIKGDYVTSFGGGAGQFLNCTSLTSVDFPELVGEDNGNYQDSFNGCTALVTVKLPKLQRVNNYTFKGCTNLPGIVLPSWISGHLQEFHGCSKLKYFDCGKSTSTSTGNFCSGSAFQNCTILDTMIIRDPNVRGLSNTGAFNNSPFASGGSGGTLYVPQSLISSYQSASNWSTILGYANNQIKSIESTHTDPTAPIDLTLYYADGTLIPT